MKYILICFLFLSCANAVTESAKDDENNIHQRGNTVYDRGHLRVVKISVDSVEYLVAYYGNLVEGGVSIIRHDHNK